LFKVKGNPADLFRFHGEEKARGGAPSDFHEDTNHLVHTSMSKLGWFCGSQSRMVGSRSSKGRWLTMCRDPISLGKTLKRWSESVKDPGDDQDPARAGDSTSHPNALDVN
jgi:hypothetical protein